MIIDLKDERNATQQVMPWILLLVFPIFNA